MAKQASINATPEAKALRSIGRVRSLKEIIERRKKKGYPIDSYVEEMNRRMAELNQLKDQINDL